MAVKFNFQQVLLKTLIPTMNILKDTAVLNIIKTDGKCVPAGCRRGEGVMTECQRNKGRLQEITSNFY